MNLEQKKISIAELGENLRNSQAAFLADYRGITCHALTEMRRKLKSSGGSVQVVKNTLMKRVLLEHDGLADKLAVHLKGPTLVVWAKSDPVTPAKVLTDFAKENEKFVLKAGILDGVVMQRAEIEALSKLPSKKELQAKLLSLINAVATKVVCVVNAPASSLVRVLEAWRVELEKNQK